MADVAEIASGPLRDWLATNRQTLNGRFRLAQRRFPQLEPDTVLALCHELLPPLAGQGEGGTAALLSAAYDLVLLHAGRGTLAVGGGLPGVHALLRQTFPRIRGLLLTRPQYLPGALSNAVENLGPRGAELAHGLAAVAEFIQDGDQLLDAGAVLAWRLGEARLRGWALEIARRLPPRVVLLALGLGPWPDLATPLLIAGLVADGWRRPESLFTTQTLAGLSRRSPQQVEKLSEEIATAPAGSLASWSLAGRVGGFAGFEGHFDRPPLLLDAGKQGSRHRFFARSGEHNYQIDADVFGWVCRLNQSADFPVGRLYQTKGKAPFPHLVRATSHVALDDALAFTLPDSFRVRILTPPRRPV